MVDLTAAEAIRAAASKYGLTQRQLGSMLGVSDRMVRAVLRGDKPGGNLAGAARQLASEGRITSQPERREQRVRTSEGVTAEPVKSSAAGTPGGSEDVRYSVESGGRSQTAVKTPSRGLGRERARSRILGDLKAHRGGKLRAERGGQRVRVKVTTKGGKTYTLGAKGGYDPKALARRMEDEGDPFEWLSDEVESIGAYGTVSVGASNISAVELTYF